MARTIRDTQLDTREARSRLQARGKPHYRLIEPGLHLGYRKPKGRKGRPAAAGVWVERYHVKGGVSKQGKHQPYVVETIGIADDFSNADGVAILSFTDAQDAVREHMVRRAKSAAGIGDPLTVKTALENYYAALESEGKDATDARYSANAHILPTFGDVEVATLTTLVLRRWLGKLARTPARLRTKRGKQQRYRELRADDEEAVRRRQAAAKRVWATMRAALNLAFRDGFVESDAAWRKIKLPKNIDGVRTRYLKIAEAQRLINAADLELRPLVMGALQSGARYGELCRLTVADFDADAGTLHIRKSKSGKARHVTLTDEGAAFYSQHTAGRAGSEPMFRKADGTAWLKSHQRRPVLDACEHARISPPITFHGLRHTWASHAVMNGVPLIVVAGNLGHSTVRMVEKHYGHLAKSYVVKAIRDHAPSFGFVPDPAIAALAAKKTYHEA